jgi:hypothetical protein
LFGVSNTNSCTAVKLTSDALILATGTTGISNIASGISGVGGGGTGVRITNNSFGIATGSGNSINAVIMNSNGITIGSAVVGLGSLGDATDT